MQMYPTHDIVTGSLTTCLLNFSAMSSAVPEMWKINAHVQIYSTHDVCITLNQCVSNQLTTHQISAQCVQLFPRYEKRVGTHVRTCRGAPSRSQTAHNRNIGRNLQPAMATCFFSSSGSKLVVGRITGNQLNLYRLSTLSYPYNRKWNEVMSLQEHWYGINEYIRGAFRNSADKICKGWVVLPCRWGYEQRLI